MAGNKGIRAMNGLLLPTRKDLLCYALPLFSAGVAFYLMVWTVLHRVDYAYELEWIEGGVLQQVVRIREGLSPYAKPSMEYVSGLYAPLYYYISALSTLLFGQGLPALRAVSVLATLLTSTVIAGVVWQVSRSVLGALLGFLAWGSMFVPSAFWFDVARIDSLWTLFLGLTVLSLLRHCRNGSRVSFFATAICFACAVLTKQASLFVAPFLFLVAWLWKDWRFALQQALITGALVGICGLFLQWQSGGWFYYFTMQMATHHGMNYSMWKTFLQWDTVGEVLFLLVFSLLFVWWVDVDTRVRTGWGFLLAGFASMSLISRIYPGGVENVLMPYYMVLVMMSTSCFAVLVGQSKRYVGLALAALLLSANYYHHWVSQPEEYRIPNRKPGGDDAIGDALVHRIAQVPGRVCVTMHGYLGWLAGKGFCAHRFFVDDLLKGGRQNLVEALKAEARSKLMSGYYQVLVIDSYAEIEDLGVKVTDIPYTVTAMDGEPGYPFYEFYPIVSGSKPAFWLEYNGNGYIKKP